MTASVERGWLDACRCMLQALGHAAWLVDGATLRVSGVNDLAAKLLGRPAERLVGAEACGLISTPADNAYWRDVRAGHIEDLCSDTILAGVDGRLLTVTRRIQRLAGHQAGSDFLVSVEDRSQYRLEQDARDGQVAELQATLESTADGILVTGLNGGIRAFNRRFARIWGMPADLLLERQDAAVFAWMQRSAADPCALRHRIELIRADALLEDRERIALQSGQVLDCVTLPQMRHGQATGRVWTFRDQTELVLAGRRIETLSTTDALTGLPNRRQIGLTLEESIRQAVRCEGTLALMVLDLDRFKLVNDSLGGRIGDQVLLGAAERLKGCLHQGDLVARIGDDKFALLLHTADHRSAESAARRVLAAISQPCAMDGMQFTLTCSVGVALFPADGMAAEPLMRNAETAMQRAKLAGRACFRFHQPRHDADLRKRMRLDHAMRQALASHRFRLKYQPQIDLHTGAVVGAEALIRWRDPELGDVSPGEFVPVAEDSGFIVAVGDWVLGQAVRQAAAWRRDGLAVPVAINVSALQLKQTDFIDRVAAALHEHGLPGRMLELELTESILVREGDEALEHLAQLAQLGVQMAIDDFGTGYSSLAYLKRFPIRRLKIDHSFIDGLPHDDSDGAIVRAIVQMAHALGMRVVAEGVESDGQHAFLRRAGCDQYQGTLFAPALDAMSFMERVRGVQPQLPGPRRLTLVARS